MFGEYHATFLAAEVLALSVHRNILCPVGVRCCTCNLSLSSALKVETATVQSRAPRLTEK